MEFKIRKDEFLRGLYLAQGIADRKSTLPILANVLVRTEGKVAPVRDQPIIRLSACVHAIRRPLVGTRVRHNPYAHRILRGAPKWFLARGG